jgi:regulator of protease activity HflC (stomatin/prohibitin superfamily)
MNKTSSLPGLIFVVILGVGLTFAYLEFSVSAFGQSAAIAVGSFVIAIVASYSIKIADQWEKTVVLRLGRFRSLEGPGLFLIIPIIETVPYWIDTRVITRSFRKDSYQGYGASGRRRRVVLEGRRSEKGGARRCRL